MEDMEKLPVFEGIKTADELLQEELAKIKPATTPVVTPQQPTPITKADSIPTLTKATPEPIKVETKQPELPKEDKTLKELDDKLTVLKERGNMHFKKQSYKEAVKSFSEGINMFEAAGSPMNSDDIKTKIT